MTITLNPEQELIIQRAIQSGVFRSVGEFIDSALKALDEASPVQENEQLTLTSYPKKSFAQFLLESPLPGSGLNLQRIKDYPRTVEL